MKPVEGEPPRTDDEASRRDPPDVLSAEGLAAERDRLKEIATNARKTFFAILVACAYSLLTIGMTEDIELLGNASTLALPIIQVDVPVVWFYAVGPVLLLGAYLYLHFYLFEMWRGVRRLLDSYENEHNGKRAAIERELYPWVLSTGLVRAHVLGGDSEPRSVTDRLENWTPIVLAWGVVPFVIFMFWGRYLMRHDWSVTSAQAVVLAASITGAFVLYRRAVRILTAGAHATARRRSPGRGTLLSVACATGLTAFLLLCSLSAIHSASDFTCDSYGDRRGCGALYMVGRLFTRFGRPPHAQLAGQDANGVSLRDGDLRQATAAKAQLAGADLSRSDFRFSDLTNATLAGADLSGADLGYALLAAGDLKGARLVEAIFDGAELPMSELGGATLDDASFRGADLMGADLSHVTGSQTDLTDADLRRAKLNSAELPAAKLDRAQLQGAVLTEANLNEATLIAADLRRAKFEDALLSGADLTDANLADADLPGVDLSGGSLQNGSLGSVELSEALATDANLQQVRAQCAQLVCADLRRSNFTSADLQFADLSGALLQRAVLKDVSLQSAHLAGASLAFVDFTGANLTGAVLDGANLSGARLREATGLQQSQVDGACGDDETALPAGLVIRSCAGRPVSRSCARLLARRSCRELGPGQ